VVAIRTIIQAPDTNPEDPVDGRFLSAQGVDGEGGELGDGEEGEIAVDAGGQCYGEGFHASKFVVCAVLLLVSVFSFVLNS